MTPEELFAGHPDALAVLARVRTVVDGIGAFEVRASRSQVVFRGRRGFAYLWLPGQYLAHPSAEVVLSIVLGRHDRSPRFKEVAHPSPAHWMHHLEIHRLADIDDEVTAWLREAVEHAA